MRSHDSPVSVLRHYAILILVVAVVLVAAYRLADYFDWFVPLNVD